MSLITILTVIPHLLTTSLDYFVFPYLKNNVFEKRLGTIPELMQVIIDNCNLIEVPTLRRSFENIKQRELHYVWKLKADILKFVNTIGIPHNRQVTHNAPLYENQDFSVLKITNLTFETDI
jgi:hypothetical protein